MKRKQGQLPEKDGKRKLVSLFLDVPEYEALKTIAEKEGVNASFLIRRAIKKYLETYESSKNI